MISQRWGVTATAPDGQVFDHEVYGEGELGVLEYVRSLYPYGVMLRATPLDEHGNPTKLPLAHGASSP